MVGSSQQPVCKIKVLFRTSSKVHVILLMQLFVTDILHLVKYKVHLHGQQSRFDQHFVNCFSHTSGVMPSVSLSNGETIMEQSLHFTLFNFVHVI